MSDKGGSRRAAYAAAATAVFTVIGVLALVLGSTGGTTPPRPTAAQAGTLRVAGHDRGGDLTGSTSPTPGKTSTRAAGSRPGNAPLGSPRSRPDTRAPKGPVLSRSRPVHLDIDSIDVHASLLELGLNADGSLEVPDKPLLAGWFTRSPTPGQVGPSVIAGHVDSDETGPAVFYRLGSLAPGDKVGVTRADGSRATFVVDGVREYPKTHFPTVPVYGNTDRAELRLITCGDWDVSRQEYDGNVVAFAHLIPVARS